MAWHLYFQGRSSNCITWTINILLRKFYTFQSTFQKYRWSILKYHFVIFTFSLWILFQQIWMFLVSLKAPTFMACFINRHQVSSSMFQGKTLFSGCSLARVQVDSPGNYANIYFCCSNSTSCCNDHTCGGKTDTSLCQSEQSKWEQIQTAEASEQDTALLVQVNIICFVNHNLS